jgi:hypothetical protein
MTDTLQSGIAKQESDASMHTSSRRIDLYVNTATLIVIVFLIFSVPYHIYMYWSGGGSWSLFGSHPALSRLQEMDYLLRNVPDRLEGQDVGNRYMKEKLEPAFQAFKDEARKLDVKNERSAARSIVEYFDAHIKGRYKGQIYFELDDEVRVIAQELMN